MSHTQTRTIICPNCGAVSTGNFCSQCGQSNRLHRETFWSLITHFFAHYLHYDSKFWQTLKALWFSPGKLTLAYWKDQRMRFVAPVALYIFISTVFFLVTYVSPIKIFEAVNFEFTLKSEKIDPADLVTMEEGKWESVKHFLDFKILKLGSEEEKPVAYLMNKFLNSFVKIFFFMIPIMGVVLKLLFNRRKNLLFVDHAVFSLHYHSLWFTVFMFFYFVPFSDTYHQQIFMLLLLVITGIYLFLAIRKVYRPGWLKTAFATLVISVSYSVLLVLFALIYVTLLIVFY